MDHFENAVIQRGNAIVRSTPLMSLIERAIQTLNQDLILATASEISEAITPHTVCKDGCSHCCYMAVAITEFEADKIAAFTGRAKAMKGDALTYMENPGIEKYATVPCTFLIEGKCSIYPVRPLACRLHHNLSPDSSVCEIKLPLESMEATPSLNLMEISFWFANLSLRRNEGFADIRDYFPKSN